MDRDSRKAMAEAMLAIYEKQAEGLSEEQRGQSVEILFNVALNMVIATYETDYVVTILENATAQVRDLMAKEQSGTH